MRAVGDRGAWRAAGAAGRRTGSGVGVVRKRRGSWQDPEEAGGTKSDRDDRMEDVGPVGGDGGGERSWGRGEKLRNWSFEGPRLDGKSPGSRRSRGGDRGPFLNPAVCPLRQPLHLMKRTPKPIFQKRPLRLWEEPGWCLHAQAWAGGTLREMENRSVPSFRPWSRPGRWRHLGRAEGTAHSLPPHSPLTSPRCWQQVLGMHLEL